MIARLATALALVALATTALADTSAGGPASVKGIKCVVHPSGLEYCDVRKGTGAEAKQWKTVLVHYTGWLADSKKKFDSSLDRHEPFKFTLGAGQVIRGWDEGVEGMKVGGRRQLHIPAKLAYGQNGAGSAIPPNADLIFDVALVAVQ
jgi:FKBP-type peptidyl-prolyl cis-trans isomerase